MSPPFLLQRPTFWVYICVSAATRVVAKQLHNRYFSPVDKNSAILLQFS